MEYNLAREEQTKVLNPYQSAYLLLDNGRKVPGHCVQKFRALFDNSLSRKKTSYNGM